MAYWVKFLRRNKVVIIFPLLTAAAITADLVHTRRWKAQRAAAAAQQPGPPLPGGKMFFAHVKIDRKLMLGILVPLLGYGLGSALDRTETNRMVMFRDKSALYGREMAPGEKPSWP